MKLKFLIIFQLLQDLLVWIAGGAVLHLVYRLSKMHGALLTVLLLTFWVTEYSIKLLSKDYWNELLNRYYDKLDKENTDGGEEKGSTGQG